MDCPSITTCPGMLVNLTVITYISPFSGWLMCGFGIILANVQLRISCIRANLLPIGDEAEFGGFKW